MFPHLLLIFFLFFFQVQSFHVEDIKQDYDTGKDGISMVTFKVDFDQVDKLEDALKAKCSRELKFYKRWNMIITWDQSWDFDYIFLIYEKYFFTWRLDE